MAVRRWWVGVVGWGSSAYSYIFVNDKVLGVPGEIPTTPTVLATPVQFEAIFGGLTGCQLPDGRGLLMWTRDSARASVRCAVQPAPGSWLVDNVVASGDAATVITGTQSCSAVCYVIAGEVYATISEPLQCRIFKADDPADPVAGGWTLHGTLAFGTGTNAPFGNRDQVASVPVITSGGTWAIVQGYSAQYWFGASPTGFERDSWAHLTSPDGVTWTRQAGAVNNNLASEIFQTRQTVEDPSGQINFSYQADSSTTTSYYATPATGGALTNNGTAGDAPQPVPILRNAADEIYAIDKSENYRLRTGDGSPYADWTDTGVSWTGGLVGGNTPYKLFVLGA